MPPSQNATAVTVADRKPLPSPSVAAKWPSWADRATESGEPNGWFDPAAHARRLSPEQVAQLPALIESARAAVAPSGTDGLAKQCGLLELVAARVDPRGSADGARTWAAAMLASLARHPGDLIRAAIDDAGFTQFQWLNEVGPFLARHIAARVAVRHAKLHRLDQIARAAACARPEIGDAERADVAAGMAGLVASMRAGPVQREVAP